MAYAHCRVGSIRPKDDRIWVTVSRTGDYDIERLHIDGQMVASRAVRHRFPERTQHWKWH